MTAGNRGFGERAMKYLCMVYCEESKLASLSQADYDKLVAEHGVLNEALLKSGHYITAHALEPVRTAKTVRVRNGKLSATDGPFAETKEQLAGVYLIDARDLDDALQVAGRIPAVRLGTVEVRPVMELQQSRRD
jgi:hypothetical protein